MQISQTGLARVHPPTRFSMALSALRDNISDVPLPVVLLLTTILLPRHFDFNLGSLSLSVQRLVLIAWLPVAVLRLISGRGPRLRSFDFLFVAGIVYYALAIFSKEPIEIAIVTSGIISLEALGSYLIARVYIRNQHEFLGAVKLLFYLALLAIVVAIPESLFYSHWIKNLAASLAGVPPEPLGESRLGLLRAMATFEHPIHYGVFCAGVLALVWFSERTYFKRFFYGSLLAAGIFFSLSAGPMLGIWMVIVGALWEVSTRRIKNRAWMTIGVLVSCYVILLFVAKRTPFEILVTSVVLDSGSAFYRMIIWDYGIQNVLANPWFGAPLGLWDRPGWMVSGSVDNYWLTIALWGGIPSVALHALSILCLLRAVNAAPPSPEQADRRRCRYAWSAVVLMLCAVGATVHYWRVLGVFYAFCLGMGAWLAEQRQEGRQLAQETAPIKRGRRRIARVARPVRSPQARAARFASSSGPAAKPSLGTHKPS